MAIPTEEEQRLAALIDLRDRCIEFADVAENESVLICDAGDTLGEITRREFRKLGNLIDMTLGALQAPEPTDGFPFVVTCHCGAKTGFPVPTAWLFACRDCGRWNKGDDPATESGTEKST